MDSGDEDDDYERERRENIRRNQELLKDLDLLNHRTPAKRGRASSGAAASGDSRKPKPAVPAKRRASGAAASQPQRVQPRRTSNRIAGLQADSETIRIKLEEEAKEARKAVDEQRRARHEQHDLAFLLANGSDGDDVVEQKEGLELTLRRIAGGKSGIDDKKRVKYESEYGEGKEGKHKELKAVLNKMKLRSVHKVVQRRVYSMAMHPNADSDLIFIGDKEGSIGVWDPLAPATEEDEDEEDYMPSGHSWNLQVHGKSPITCLRFDPITPDALYSSSYDSTIRVQSLVGGTSTEVWSGDEDVLLSIFDILAPQSHPSAFLATPAPGLDERSMWIADHRGGVNHVDLRQGGAKRGGGSRSTTKRWQICERKIGGMSINPTVSSCISVASLDQHVRLFDVRNLKTLAPTSDAPYSVRHVDRDTLTAAETTAQIGSHKARLACTSVDWDPSGTKLACVSYDDYVKVWDMEPSWLTTAAGPPRAKGVKKEEGRDEDRPSDVMQNMAATIKHNNQTGKWLTLFRARFNANPTVESHFSIGSMDRRAEIWAGDGTLLRGFFDPVHVTAVPAVTTTHPRRVGRLATGNASGKCTFWAPLDG